MSKLMKLLTLVCLSASFTLTGCAAKHPEPVAMVPSGQPVTSQPAAQSPEGVSQGKTEASEAAQAAETARAQAEASAQQASTMPGAGHEQANGQRAIYFDFDSYLLDQAAKATLEQVYRSVSASKTSYTVEGYCDERGDDEYNLALGERRAAGVRSYLAARGVAADRLTVVSYGREFPANPAHTEDAWRLNRRVEVMDAGAPKPDQRYGKNQ